MNKSTVLIASGVLTGLAGQMPAAAQESGAFALEEVVVTAQKREENVQKTAVSIGVVSGEQLREKGINSLDNALRELAGVSVAGLAGSGGQIVIRGVGGSNLDTNVADPAVALMVDGSYTGRAEMVLSSAIDVQRVEVMRGPQGTVYGRNATGGAVNLITNAPSDKFESAANLQVGNYSLLHVDGMLNVPIADSLALRLVAWKETRDGYISRVTPYVLNPVGIVGDTDGTGAGSANRWGYRVKLGFEPSDVLSIIATYEHQIERSNQMDTVPIPGSAGKLTFPPFLGPYNATGWVTSNPNDPWAQDAQHPHAVQDNKLNTVTMQIDWDLGIGQATFLPSYAWNQRCNDSSFLFGVASPGTDAYTCDANAGAMNAKQTQQSIEARLSSKESSPFTWLAGVYYSKDENDDPNAASVNPVVTAATTPGSWAIATYRQPAESSAVFGQVTVPITDIFRVTAGLRYAVEDRSQTIRYANAAVPATSPLYPLRDAMGAYDSGLVNLSDSHKPLTYKAGVELDLAPDSMVYAQISTGFKAGGFNTVGSVPPLEFKEEKLVAYELGSKNRFLENRVQLNAEAYYYDYTNRQIFDFSLEPIVQATGNTATNPRIVRNAGDGKNYGFEIESQWLVTANDELRLSVAYAKGEYGEYSLAPNPFALAPYNTTPFPITGEVTEQTPEWTGNVGYRHTWNLAAGNLSLDLSSKLSTSYYATVERYLPVTQQDSYTRSDLNLNYRPDSGNWSAGLFAKNLENEAQTQLVLPGMRRIVNDPRTYGLSLGVTF